MRPTSILSDIYGVVVSAGRMMNAVKVRTTKQKYNHFLQKHFPTSRHRLVSDPTNAVRAGDIIRMTTERHSRHIRHVVTEIVAPWGVPIAERPAVRSQEEREALRSGKRERKLARREERRGGKMLEGGDKGDGGGTERLRERAGGEEGEIDGRRVEEGKA